MGEYALILSVLFNMFSTPKDVVITHFKSFRECVEATKPSWYKSNNRDFPVVGWRCEDMAKPGVPA